MPRMSVEYHPPDEKGVTSLMYVGDDGLPAAPDYSRWWLLAGGLAVAAWLFGRAPRARRRR